MLVLKGKSGGVEKCLLCDFLRKGVEMDKREGVVAPKTRNVKR